MPHIVHQPNSDLLCLTWSESRQVFMLTDPEKRVVLGEFSVRVNHNGRRLANPELKLPELARSSTHNAQNSVKNMDSPPRGGGSIKPKKSY